MEKLLYCINRRHIACEQQHNAPRRNFRHRGLLNGWNNGKQLNQSAISVRCKSFFFFFFWAVELVRADGQTELGAVIDAGHSNPCFCHT